MAKKSAAAPIATLFSEQFLERLRHWIGPHHTVYPRLPPQDIYFESLVERAYLHSGWPRDQVVLENPNSPKASRGSWKKRP